MRTRITRRLRALRRRSKPKRRTTRWWFKDLLFDLFD